MIKVLFVCLGNICRSPLAEAIFKDLIKNQGLESMIFCASSGTSDYNIGSGPDSRTLKNALKNNIHIDHFAQQLVVADLEKYDYLLAMDQKNKDNILGLGVNGQNFSKKVFLMRDFDGNAMKRLDVPDPYFGDEDGFQQVHDILIEACFNFLEFLKKKHHLKDLN